MTRKVRRSCAKPLVRFGPSAPAPLEAHHREVRRASSLKPTNPHSMQSLRRTAVTAARKGQSPLPRQSRRFAHDEAAHGHGPASGNEPMGVRQPPLPLAKPPRIPER